MEDGSTRVSGAGEDVSVVTRSSPSYWLDACEDISCDLIHFDDGSIVSEQVDNNLIQDGLVNDFFGGIDHILDSIKNGSGLPVATESNSILNGNGNHDGAFALQAEISDQKDSFVKNGSTGEKHGRAIEVYEGSGAESNGYKSSIGNEEGKTMGDSKGNGGGDLCREHHVDGEERFSKRARIGNHKNERLYPGRVNYHPKERERGLSRKRPREWDEVDRKEKDSGRKRENYGSCGRRDVRDRDWRDRERGYWERDKSGSNDMVFRIGTWEADREGKLANDIKQESNGKVETNTEEPKERVPEEQARKYQLDVLEQAKQKNTIAFLETGAGKTLIAVLLMKSIHESLQKQNKKMLAVFLVPKVPLVYQVI